MNKEDILKEKFGTEGGWKVPEGYFESFYEQMSERLPAYPEAPAQKDMTIWQRVKPYVYMAAMFAGIWLTMKMFYNVSSGRDLAIENPPAHIAMAMQEISGTEPFIAVDNFGDLDLEDEVIESYSNINDLEKDFGFELSDEYKRINIEEVTN